MKKYKFSQKLEQNSPESPRIMMMNKNTDENLHLETLKSADIKLHIQNELAGSDQNKK